MWLAPLSAICLLSAVVVTVLLAPESTGLKTIQVNFSSCSPTYL